MKVILVVVSTLNGKITKGDDPDIYTWTSREDQEFFFALLKKSKFLVMGSRTYEAVRDIIDLNDGKFRIILTSRPKSYMSESIKGKLEFSDESPKQLVKRFSNKSYKTMLLVGGSEVHASFLKSNLVDEIYVTIEPLLFGQGKPMIAPVESTTSLKLKSVKKLNKKGTLLLKYTVKKTS